MTLFAALDTLLHPRLRDTSDSLAVFRARAVALGGLVAAGLGSVLVAAHAANGSADLGLYLSLGLFPLIGGGVLLDLRIRGRFRRSTLGGILLITLVIIWRCIDDGGIDSVATAWLPLVPVAATLVLGRRAGLVVGGLALLGLVLSTFPELVGLPITEEATTPAMRLVSLAVLTMMVLGLVMLWDRERLSQQARLLATNAELQRSHAILEARTRESEALATMRSRLVTMVSHELNTPLNGIVGLAETLALSEHDPERAETARNLHRSSVLLESLIRDLMELSRLENEALPQFPEPTSLIGLVNEVADLLKPRVFARQLELVVDVPDRDLMVDVDPARIRQVLVNLVQNAIKFTDRGEVRVSLAQTRRGTTVDCLLEVSDTGIGICEQDHARVFERFEQGDADVRRRHGGTGLGLAVVREVVEAMDGRVELRSSPGQGATFSVHLSLPPAGQQVRAVEPASSEVLVVDDNPVNLKVAEMLLSSLGMQVRTASGGLEALDLLAHYDPDLVLMDCMMPDLTGWEATSRLRASGRMVPIVALTADASAEARARSLAAGMDDHLTKPLRRDRLVQLLGRYGRVQAKAV